MNQQNQCTISQALPGFVQYMSVERRFSLATIRKYQDNVGWFRRDVGNLPLANIRLEHFIALK